MTGRALASLTAALAALTACQPQPKAPTFTPQDAATLKAMFDSTATYIRAGDWDKWAAQYTDDAVLQPPNAPTVTGRANLVAWGHAFPPVTNLTFSGAQVWGDGNLAYGTSRWALTLQGIPPDSGKQLVVFRRAPAGSWQLAAVSFSSDVPLPPPPPAPKKK